MFGCISGWFYKVTKGWVALVALALFTLFLIFVLPGQTARAELASAEAGTPDLSLTYSVKDLYRMAEVYGPDGRKEYIRIRFSFDLVWPLVYTFFLVTSSSWVFRKAFTPTSRWRLAVLLPLVGILLDFFENLSTSLVMLRYPLHTPIVDILAPVFTFSKWITLTVCFLLLLVGLLIAFRDWVRHTAGKHA